jgi:hypothetical protein
MTKRINKVGRAAGSGFKRNPLKQEESIYMQNQGEDENNKVDGGMDVRCAHGVKDIHKNNQRKV